MTTFCHAAASHRSRICLVRDPLVWSGAQLTTAASGFFWTCASEGSAKAPSTGTVLAFFLGGSWSVNALKSDENVISVLKRCRMRGGGYWGGEEVSGLWVAATIQRLKGPGLITSFEETWQRKVSAWPTPSLRNACCTASSAVHAPQPLPVCIHFIPIFHLLCCCTAHP